MSTSVTKIEIEHTGKNYAINCLVVNGNLVASSQNEGTTLSSIDAIADELSKALSVPLTSIHKLCDDYDDILEFDFIEMMESTTEFVTDHVNESKAMPMDLEYSNIVFDFDQIILLLTEDKLTEFNLIIISDE